MASSDDSEEQRTREVDSQTVKDTISLGKSLTPALYLDTLVYLYFMICGSHR